MKRTHGKTATRKTLGFVCLLTTSLLLGGGTPISLVL